MRKKVPSRKKNVLSVRITDGEMEHIQELMESARMNASEFMRNALFSYADRCGSVCPSSSAVISRRSSVVDFPQGSRRRSAG